MRLLREGVSVAVDGEGIYDDQANALRNAAPLHYAAGIRVDVGRDGTGPRVVRVPSPTDRAWDRGPLDVIGDVHGCLDELLELLDRLGYMVSSRTDEWGDRRFSVSHPGGRRLAFVGDLADRGPDSLGCLSLACDAVSSGAALWTMGNHDWYLIGWLEGKKTSMRYGFGTTVDEFAHASQSTVTRIRACLRTLPSHLVLDGGAMVLTHAGCRQEMQGRDSSYVGEFCMFGEATGKKDENGLPVRADWAASYDGPALVVHGHTPLAEPTWSPRGNALCVDTGCVFGGSLTALRWPEREIVSVPAHSMRFEHAAANRAP
jgi:protein phosphatase